MAVASFGGGSPGGPLAAGPVAGQGDDRSDQASELVFCAGGMVSAVRAAGIGGNVLADEGEQGRERDEPRAGAGLGGGAGCRRCGHVVDDQQGPGFLAGEFGRLAAQRAAGTADGLLQVKESDFDLPPLRIESGNFPSGEVLVVEQGGDDPDPGSRMPSACRRGSGS
jgi:hypothetical protein